MRQGGKKKKSFLNMKWNRNTLIYIIILLIAILVAYYILTSEGETRNIVSIKKANTDEGLINEEITVEGYYNSDLDAITHSIGDTALGDSLRINHSESFNETQLSLLNDDEKYYFTGVLKEIEDKNTIVPGIKIRVLELTDVKKSG